MIKIIITEICRPMGRNQSWSRFKKHEINTTSVAQARVELKEYLGNGIYNVKRPRQYVFVDTKSRGTIRTGYIYSGIEDTNYLQAWCSFYETTDNKTITFIDLDKKN